MIESREIETSIPRDLLRRLNDEPELVSLAQLREIPADRWVSALDGASLHARAKRRLAQACADFPEFVSVCRRLLLQVGFGNALANEIRSDPNWSALQSMIDKSGLRKADSRDEFARRLGTLLVQKPLLFWCLRIAFSRGTLSALVTMFTDREASVRLEALKALESYDISKTEADLIYALDDTSEQVRSRALQDLKQWVPPERLAMITAEAVEEASRLSELVQTARQQIQGLYRNVPGLEPLLDAVRRSAKAISSALGSVSNVAEGAAVTVAGKTNSVRSSLAEKFRKRVHDKQEDGK